MAKGDTLYAAADVRHVSGAFIARCFGVTKQAVAKWVDPPRHDDGTYSLPDIIQWRMARYEEEYGDGSDDPEMQRWRRIRADVEEYKFAELRKELLRRDDVKEGLSSIAGVLRRAGDKLAAISEEARAIHDDMLEQVVAMISRRFGDPELDDEGGA